MIWVCDIFLMARLCYLLLTHVFPTYLPESGSQVRSSQFVSYVLYSTYLQVTKNSTSHTDTIETIIGVSSVKVLDSVLYHSFDLPTYSHVWTGRRSERYRTYSETKRDTTSETLG